jgi:hypothetical protein
VIKVIILSLITVTNIRFTFYLLVHSLLMAYGEPNVYAKLGFIPLIYKLLSAGKLIGFIIYITKG